MTYYADPFRTAYAHTNKLGIEYRRVSEFVNGVKASRITQKTENSQPKQVTKEEKRATKQAAPARSRTVNRKSKEGRS